MTVATVPAEVVEYLQAVRAALVDVPAAERDDLLAEVEASLVETTAETVGPIAARLGPPERFAAELRAAAGLTSAPEPADGTVKPIRQRLKALGERVATRPAVGSARRIAHELAPIWWVVRGYLAVAAIALLLGSEWSTRLAALPRIGSGTIGLMLICVVAALSVAVGLWARRRAMTLRRATVIFNVAFLLVAIPVLGRISDDSAYRMLVNAAYAPKTSSELPQGLFYDGSQVDNIYPFGRDGRLLHDVLLYDGAGRPIEIGSEVRSTDRRAVLTRDGAAVFHAFPIRYYEPGTRTVAHPDAIPPGVAVPHLVTPPLERRPQ